MAKRTKIPKTTEVELFSLSTRRCCLCFGIDHDFNEKKGQIAHLDHDPSNNDINNLAWLCLSHHDSYDGKTSQSKNYQIHEIKIYRQKLYKNIDEIRSSVYLNFKDKVVNSIDNKIDIKLEIRKTLRHINPEIIEMIDKGIRDIEVMISIPKLSSLQILASENEFEDYLKMFSTGAVIMGGHGNKIGNAINDINEGFMQGYLLTITDRLAGE